jgi:Tfp pilus assembly protein PilF
MAMVGPLLDDPVRGVRIEAARNLTAVAPNHLDPRLKKAFDAALDEFRQTMEYSADFAASRINLGTIYAYLGQPGKAEENFKKAVRIDRDFYQAQLNLAVMYSREGKSDQAETLLRSVLKTHPGLPDVQYSLGLLLAEKKQYAQAARYLQGAARAMPQNPRVHYNLGQLLAYLGRDARAAAALSKALELDPLNMDYLSALAKFYIRRGKLVQAKKIAEKMTAAHPSNPLGANLLKFIRKKSGP